MDNSFWDTVLNYNYAYLDSVSLENWKKDFTLLKLNIGVLLLPISQFNLYSFCAVGLVSTTWQN